MASIEVGAEVVTADGQALGRVKHTSPSAFQVDAPRQQDYWLETTIVKNSSSLRVELLIEQSQIGAYKMDDAYQFVSAPKLHPPIIRKASGQVSGTPAPGLILTGSFYDLSKPGKYSVHIEVLEMRSPVLHFEIQAPKRGKVSARSFHDR